MCAVLSRTESGQLFFIIKFQTITNELVVRSKLFIMEYLFQIAINGKMFAFDNVFDPSSPQEAIYDACAAPFLEKLFKGKLSCTYRHSMCICR